MHFALIHGAYHGAWCWDELRRELETAGHTTSAADLPIEDPDAGADRYAEAAVLAVPPQTQGVVVVGHSLGGLTAPVVASMLPVRGTVYLCALLPAIGMSFDDQRAEVSTGFVPSQRPVRNPDGSASWPVQGAIEAFYHDCDAASAERAARRLRRQHWRITQEITPLTHWPPGPSAYVLCSADRIISNPYSIQAARQVLGVEPMTMQGGHSPFLARPVELAAILVTCAEEFERRGRPA